MTSTWYGSNWIKRAKRIAIYLRDGFTCVYCGKSLLDEPSANVHLDHRIPRQLGGSNDASNLVTACRSCNCARGCRMPGEDESPETTARIQAQTAKPLNMDLARSLLGGRPNTQPEVE